MGLRTAATKLGFRLAVTSHMKFISSSWVLLCTKRYNSSLATTSAPTAVEKCSNLYLCFDERKPYSRTQLCTNLVVRSISLDTYDDNRDKELRDDAAHRFSDVKDTYDDNIDDDHDDSIDGDHYHDDENEEKNNKEIFRQELAAQTKIIRSGSQILFTVGQTSPRDIGWVNPFTHPVKFHVSSQTETKIKSFSTPKSDMRWEMMDGKLYCFDNCPPGPWPMQSFEVLDPETEDTKWQRLSEPPFIRTDGGTDNYSVLFFYGSKKILGWEDEKRGVFCFDAAKPEDGWMESPSNIGDSIPFINQFDTRLVIRDNHPKIGDFNLMFSYDRFGEPFLINPYFISDNCDIFHLIDEPVLLSKTLCSSYRVGYYEAQRRSRHERPRVYFDSQLVHLGSKKFCLVLHKFNEEDIRSATSTAEGNILVMEFIYDIIVSDESKDSESPIEIKTKMLGSRRFHYNLNERSAQRNDMIGAFLF